MWQFIRHPMRALGVLLLASGLSACEKPPEPGEGPCGEASDRLGFLACVHEIPDRSTWDTISLMSPAVDQLNSTKYLVPAQPVDGIETLFLNLYELPLHYDLMVQGFPHIFPGLTRTDYIKLVTDGPDRPYLAGNLTEYIDGKSTFFGFSIWDDPARPEVVLTYEQALQVYEELKARVGLTPLVFIPHSSYQRDAAEGWNAPFPVRGVDSNITYEAYTTGVGYGTVRLYDMEAFNEATEEAAFGFKDILVLAEAPFDVERVISGAITGTRQGELSHLNVRSAARGTPNCFVANPLDALAEWEGQLVRMECAETGWTVEVATAEEAEAWWEALRPEPVELPSPDLITLDFAELLALDTSDAEARREAIARYGSKGTNLAVLYQRIPSEYQLQGFLVPFAWYQAFIEDNSWTVDLGEGLQSHTFAETLDVWLQDEAFLNDAVDRRGRLKSLRDAMRDAPHDPALLEQLTLAIRSTFGGDNNMVRFRSSSNAEDALAFSGAGLYDSTSACLADELDGDVDGPSRCDPDKSSERTLSRALGKVWASMWKMEAFEERAWYGIDHRDAVMGILVNTRSKDEQANVVAFTGNPTAPDDRFLVNAQLGELDVVSSEPGVYPEKNLLEITALSVSEITRVNHSSEMPTGWVLSDAQLTTLGGLFAQIQATYPLDESAPDGATILLDTEWKVLSDGQLVIKQIRPFLRQGSND